MTTWPHPLIGQEPGLSIRMQCGFESHWGCQRRHRLTGEDRGLSIPRCEFDPRWRYQRRHRLVRSRTRVSHTRNPGSQPGAVTIESSQCRPGVIGRRDRLKIDWGRPVRVRVPGPAPAPLSIIMSVCRNRHTSYAQNVVGPVPVRVRVPGPTPCLHHRSGGIGETQQA